MRWTRPESIGDAVSGAMLGRAVEPRAGEVGADGHTHEQTCLNCGTALQRRLLPRLRPDAPMSTARSPPSSTICSTGCSTSRARSGARCRCWLAAGRADPPLHRWRARELRFADRLVPVLGLPDVRGPEPRPSISTACSGEPDAIGGTNRAKPGEIRALEASARDQAETPGQPTGSARLTDRKRAGRSRGARRDRGRNRPPVPAIGPCRATRNGSAGRSPGRCRIPSCCSTRSSTNAYKCSWVLIPLSVPFLWLLFPFSRRFRLYDHMVFVTYSLSFMTLLVVAASLFGLLGIGMGRTARAGRGPNPHVPAAQGRLRD